MAETTLNMKLLLRRAEFVDSCVLAEGEPGYHTATKEFKIGDGTTTWVNLPIANKTQIDALISSAITSHAAGYYTKEEVDDLLEAAAGAVDTKLAGYKTLQAVVNAAQTDANVFVDTVAQDANGVITITTKAVDFSAADDRFKKLQTAIEAVATEKNVFIEKIAQDAQGVITISTKAVDFEDINKAIDDLSAYVGTIPNDGEGNPLAANVVAYVDKKTAGIATDENLRTLAEQVAGNTASINAINNEETGILKQAKDYTDASDVFVTDMLTVDKFGGIAGGADLNGKTTHQILTDLLYPYIAFVINSSSRNAAAATLECGESQTLSSATISVTKKKDPITSIKLFNGSTLLEEKTGEAVANGGSITFNGFDAITVTKDNNPNLKFTVTDGTTSTDKNVGASTFVYPYYWGVCAEDATIDEALVEGLTKSVSGKGTKTDISFTCAQQKIVFAYPKAHGVLKSIIDPNNFETIDGYARSEVSITGLDGSAQAYYVYVLKDACTVTGFKVDFKY